MLRDCLTELIVSASGIAGSHSSAMKIFDSILICCYISHTGTCLNNRGGCKTCDSLMWCHAESGLQCGMSFASNVSERGVYSEYFRCLCFTIAVAGVLRPFNAFMTICKLIVRSQARYWSTEEHQTRPHAESRNATNGTGQGLYSCIICTKSTSGQLEGLALWPTSQHEHVDEKHILTLVIEYWYLPKIVRHGRELTGCAFGLPVWPNASELVSLPGFQDFSWISSLALRNFTPEGQNLWKLVVAFSSSKQQKPK